MAGVMLPDKSEAGIRFPLHGGLRKFERYRIDAKAVLGRVADKRLGIDRAGEVDVQVGAFGELVREMRGGLAAPGFARKRTHVPSSLVLRCRTGRLRTSAAGKRKSVRNDRTIRACAGEGERMIAFQCRAGA